VPGAHAVQLGYQIMEILDGSTPWCAKQSLLDQRNSGRSKSYMIRLPAFKKNWTAKL
jgi:hypothetical protein